MNAPFHYFPTDVLSIAELSAAGLDGHVVALGEGFIPADAIETPRMRALSLLPITRGRLAAALMTAAWIWGAVSEPPARHAVCRAVAKRVPNLVDRRAVLHDFQIAPGELVDLGGVAVTRPDRTVADLARSPGVPLSAVAAMMRTGADADAARAILGRLRSSGGRALALTRLEQAQADVTRYTS